MMSESLHVKVAVFDMYNGIANEGMRCIKEILRTANRRYYDIPITFDVFETRLKDEVPDMSYDIFISSGGPGDPFDGNGEAWEKNYFGVLDQIYAHNQRANDGKKYLFTICHSFQLMARYFKLAEVTSRKSTSFGIMPVHKAPAGKNDLIFTELPDPFFVADFRDYQVIAPNKQRFHQLGADILALEKIRPHIDLERAIMGIRVSPEIVGVQFHPEADRQSMLVHFQKPEIRDKVIRNKNKDKYNIILHRLEDPVYLRPTRRTVLPNFLNHAVENLRPEIVFNFAE